MIKGNDKFHRRKSDGDDEEILDAQTIDDELDELEWDYAEDME